MLKKILGVLLVVLTFVAYANVALATNGIGYQPEVPESLLK
ncbi:MAG: hypothetical protein PWP27_2241 [Clostridiales bacterium]|jgi:cyclic lactone autoinducer peptide|nr:hypothetical protein [Clostridiales bacterium]MDK2934431.1 hypothetical protein [Clostridiales bacterium]